MHPLFLLPVAVGVAVVVQAGLNRQVASSWGLAGAAVINSVIVLLAALIILALARTRPDLLPEIFRVPDPTGPIPWVHWKTIVPGLLGITIVVGLPWAFSRLGALEVILSVLVAQLAASLLWDRMVEGIPVHPLRVVGTLVAFVGATLANWKK